MEKTKVQRPKDAYKTSLIRVEPIIEIIRAAIWSGRLADEKPVSVMLVALQESAKTECLKFFVGTPTLRYVSDLTARGLNPFKKEIESLKMRHLVLLDLVRILSHGRHTAERTVQSLASLMEEGESETSDGGGQSNWSNFPKMGVLCAVTPQFFKSKRGRWRETGFLTRFVPVCFSYSDDTVRHIHAAIANGAKPPLPRPENIPAGDCLIQCPEKFSRVLGQRAHELGVAMKTYGFRYHRVLRALAKGHARQCGRGQVDASDVGMVLGWSQFFTEKEIKI